MAKTPQSKTAVSPTDSFVRRHIGPSSPDIDAMLRTIEIESLDDLVAATLPAAIRMKRALEIGRPREEHAVLSELRAMASKNKVFRSMIGQGYHDCITPAVIQRNVLENPAWYTQYTPYQAEISQGRLEALLNFQTMVSDLTGLPFANASLLDEATAAAEAMGMCQALRGGTERNAFFVAADCHPQTIAVVRTRARPLGIELIVESPEAIDFGKHHFFGVLLQYPTTDGRIDDYAEVIDRTHAAGALAVVATDLLALALIRPPGEFGADIAVGSSQRFGVSMGFGGPHAAFISTLDEHKRQLPGRIVGVSKDAAGRPAYRLAIQTREQHIRREKATSNICTAQALLAIMASMYAVYHGPEGLRRIAERIHKLAVLLRERLASLGYYLPDNQFFDTISVQLDEQSYVMGMAEVFVDAARAHGFNIRELSPIDFSISVDETTTEQDLARLVDALRPHAVQCGETLPVGPNTASAPQFPRRTSPFLTHTVFNSYHSETEMMRYLYRLQ
ncbi:MAG: glycine dehydrogenase (aminomethyl-transferring), partial [Planctomycetota bacterium]|nr:glycine dehydrogenase (aminomethyl-transferring) [Planctomycetota bacterium]